jgi:hypothetical protein
MVCYFIVYVLQYVERKGVALKREHFSFSPRAIVGEFLYPVPPDGRLIKLAEDDVYNRIEELRAQNPGGLYRAEKMRERRR